MSFAARNSSVTDLRFYAHKFVEVVNFHYHVGRYGDGRIVEVLENGMCCGSGFVLYNVDFMYRYRDCLDLGRQSATCHYALHSVTRVG